MINDSEICPRSALSLTYDLFRPIGRRRCIVNCDTNSRLHVVLMYFMRVGHSMFVLPLNLYHLSIQEKMGIFCAIQHSYP